MALAFNGKGGGGGSLRLIGPFTVNYNTPGLITFGVTLVALPTGTLVVKAWAILKAPWETTGSAVYLQLATTANNLVQYDPTVGNMGTEPRLSYFASGIPVVPPSVVVAQAADSLLVFSDPDAVAWTAGSVDVYALLA